MMRRLETTLLICLITACAPKHIAPFTPRERNYKPGKYAVQQQEAKPAVGSIYSDALPGYLEDTRAVRTGDLVVVKIDEHADAVGGATTKLSKSSSRDMGMEAMLGLLPALRKAYPDLDPATLISLASQSGFAGDGKTSRQGELRGRIAVRVKQELPNGDLFIEGTKVVMINDEEIHLYISGVIRPADIGQDNAVESSRMADAQIEFTGRGDVADTVERGWLTKILDKISPF